MVGVKPLNVVTVLSVGVWVRRAQHCRLDLLGPHESIPRSGVAEAKDDKKKEAGRTFAVCFLTYC